VERKAGVRAQGFHHVRADGQVGHEMAVHDVDVDPVGARRLQGADLLAQLGEVAGQDGGADQRGGRGGLGHGPATYVGVRRGASRAADARSRVAHGFRSGGAFAGAGRKGDAEASAGSWRRGGQLTLVCERVKTPAPSRCLSWGGVFLETLRWTPKTEVCLQLLRRSEDVRFRASALAKGSNHAERL